ncbi:hypothetical protein EMCRGX_G024056 [Ephydatia muelleri]|eukprot:Em0015g307a
MDSTMQGPPVQGPPVQGPPAQGPRKSQLSKSLADVLRDNSAHTSTLLEYFIQFMEHAGALHLVQFWLSVESFKSLADNPANRTLAASGASAATATVVTKGHYRHKSAVTGSSQWKQATELGGMSSGRNAASKATDSQQDSGQMSPGTQTGSGAQAGSGTQTGSGAQANSGAQTSSGTQAGSSAAVNNKVQLSTEKAENSQLLMSSLASDALGIYTTFVALNAVTPVGIPDNIRQKVEVDICPDDGIVSRSCFDQAQQFVFDIMENKYYNPQFQQSSFLCKYQLEYISTGRLQLFDFLLGNNVLLSYFMEFMEQENCSNLLHFWLLAENFYSQMSSPQYQHNIETDMLDAMTIYDRYFSLLATEPLRMGDVVRADVENKICDQLGPKADSFRLPQQIAYDKMDESYFPNFLQSSTYLQFLDKLLHMIHDSPQLQLMAPPTVEAESSPELTFLAPTYDLDNPDYLWKQPIRFPFRLGYVDECGFYISLMEPPPTKTGKLKDQSRKKAKWSIWKDKQVEEELAKKIARNFVTEVLRLAQHRQQFAAQERS